MLLLSGLGNPGLRYAGNRHNAGFMAIDSIATYHGFLPFKKKFKGEFSEGVLKGIKTYLLKPNTFMNESGYSLTSIVQFYKIPLSRIVIFYDEIDLIAGKFRMKQGGGIAGHNGLRSIKAHIGNDFRRARIGIGHPGKKEQVQHYVLSNFSKNDQEWLKPLLDALGKYAPLLVENQGLGSDATYQNRIHENTFLDGKKEILRKEIH